MRDTHPMQAVRNKVPPVVHATVKSFKELRRSLNPSLSVGFVPTMGALHEGHLSLVRKARQENDVVVASIFVNPSQFGVGEDFDKYPRQMEQDIDLLTEHGVEHLFAPNIDEMYSKHHITFVEPQGFDSIPEGVSRPGHFRGVATIVIKLLNVVKPTKAYFGQKDAAQVCLIQRIVEDLDMDATIVPVETVRDADGLALSSRNAYLTESERSKAPVIYKALSSARNAYLSRGSDEQLSGKDLMQIVQSVLESEPLVAKIHYVSVDNKNTMQPLEVVGADGCIISLACKIGSVRLIDNIVL